MRCYVCKTEGPNKMTWAAHDNWDWFCGYLEDTVHFCPSHKHSDERNRLFRISQTKPGDTE